MMGATHLSISLAAKGCRNGIIRTAWDCNESLRFFVSGMIGNAAFFGMDRAFFPLMLRAAARLSASQSPSVTRWSKLLHRNAASVSFFVAYLIDIALMHFLNAWLVFGLETISTRDMYLSSLATSYTAYFGTLCGSTVLQAYLLQSGASKSVAFWTVIGLGAVVNYVVLTSLNAAASGKMREHSMTDVAGRNETALGNRRGPLGAARRTTSGDDVGDGPRAVLRRRSTTGWARREEQ